ncbi:MAG: NAD(P)/FAD-dependent oxidoreductase [Phycisphaerae bacterium]
MRVAIVGSGISGLMAAYVLRNTHDITIFEANDYLGGHTHTATVQTDDDGPLAIDTGFIVYNELAYPNFVRLLRELKIPTQPSRMSFSVQSARSGIEYNGDSLNTLFAQRKNVFRPSFYGMLRDIARFNNIAGNMLRDETAPDLRLSEFLARHSFCDAFIEDHLIPMTAAVWSANPRQIGAFPVLHLARFLHNHGMLQVRNRPIWRVISGGSHTYVRALAALFSDRIRLRTPVSAIRRHSRGVEITLAGNRVEQFERVIMAVHSDQALRLLADPSTAERDILAALPFQPNEVVLHTDGQMMPHSRRAWASWNYFVPRTESDCATVTYYMNMLQSLQTSANYFVSLNRTGEIDPGKILQRFRYDHPVYSHKSYAARAQWPESSGVNRTHYCGAYWGHGFHEDGVRSALNVCRQLGVEW